MYFSVRDGIESEKNPSPHSKSEMKLFCPECKQESEVPSAHLCVNGEIGEFVSQEMDEMLASDVLQHYHLQHTEDICTRFVGQSADIYVVSDSEWRYKMRDFLKPIFP